MFATADNPTDLDNEISSLAEYVPLRDVAATLRSGRKNNRGIRNKTVHPATVYRWASPHGCRGRVLRTVLCGSVRCTTRAWLHEFFEALASASAGSADRPGQSSPTTAPVADHAPHVRTPAKRQRDVETARRDLANMGL